MSGFEKYVNALLSKGTQFPDHGVTFGEVRKRLNLRRAKWPVVALAAARSLDPAAPQPTTKAEALRVFKLYLFRWPRRISTHNAPAELRPRQRRQPGAAPRPRSVATSSRAVDATSVSFLSCYEWRQLRMIVLKKRGRRCECCGAVPSPENGVVVHVDHIKPRRKFPELALTESNLQVLCGACNHGKGNWDETDWRGPVSVPPAAQRLDDGPFWSGHVSGKREA